MRKVGLGQLIQNARRFSAWDQVFAGIIVIIVLALATYQLMVWLQAPPVSLGDAHSERQPPATRRRRRASRMRSS
jgi:ABC-type proline/glycine betaine transport system permease subunit